MHPDYHEKEQSPLHRIASRKQQSGFTLLEVLLCLTMLALIMLPFTTTMVSVASSARGAYLQSTRTIMLNSLRNETTPTDPNYVSNFTDSSMNTSISDTGQTMPFRRSVDATTTNATNSLKRTTLFYLYTNSTDTSSAPRYKTTVINYPKSIRIHFAGSGGIIDTLNRYWYMDSSLYNSTNKIPGQVSSYATTNYGLNNILNTSGNDDYLYQAERTTGTDNFSADVENGAYTVKILNAETYGGITSSHRRLYNFTLEGIQMNKDGPYSTYDTTGATNEAMIMMYDVNVSDGTLNFTCSVDSASNDSNCNLHGIEIIKRTQ